MILVHKRSLYLVLFFYSITLLFFSAQFYRIVQNLNVQNDPTIKYYAENFIFFFIISNIFIGALIVRITLKSRSIYKSLDKIIDLSQNANYNCCDQLKKIGRVGDKIAIILSQLTELNLRESLKISSLSNITQFLIGTSKANLLLLNSQGTILKCSKQLELYLDTDAQYILDRNIRDIITDIDFDGILLMAEKEHGAVQTTNTITTGEKNTRLCRITWEPITNAAHKISHMVIIMEEAVT